MSTISIEDVKKLARLAYVAIDEQEAETLRSELESMVHFFDALSEVDTSGVEPTAQVTGLTNVTRSDTVKDYGVTRDDLLKNAPASKDGYIKVKRVLNE